MSTSSNQQNYQLQPPLPFHNTAPLRNFRLKGTLASSKGSGINDLAYLRKPMRAKDYNPEQHYQTLDHRSQNNSNNSLQRDTAAPNDGAIDYNRSNAASKEPEPRKVPTLNVDIVN